jgi:hypothetical protein
MKLKNLQNKLISAENNDMGLFKDIIDKIKIRRHEISIKF